MTLSSASFTHARELEVRLLVDMVRLSRVTLLIAEPGAGKSALLRSSVVPMLTDSAHGTPPDVAVLFDAWEAAPLPVLCGRIRGVVAASADGAAGEAGSESLATTLRSAQQALASKFVIVFDRFEDYLRTSAGRVGFAEFENEFVQAVNDPSLRAHFLLAVDDDAEPLLARLRERIPRLGYSRVRLPGPNRASPAEHAARAQAVQAPASLSMRIAPVAAPSGAAPSPGLRGVTEDTVADSARPKPTSIEILAAAQAAKDMAWRAPRSRTGDAQPAAKSPPSVVTPMAYEPTAPGAPKPVQTGRAAEGGGASPAASPHAADVIELKAAEAGITAADRKAPADVADTPHREPRTAASARSDAEDIALRPPRRRLTRIAWLPIALAIFAVFVFVQPRTQQIVERAVNSLRGAESASTGEGAPDDVAETPGPDNVSSVAADAPAVPPGLVTAAPMAPPARSAQEGAPLVAPRSTASASPKPPQVAAVDRAPGNGEEPPAQRVPPRQSDTAALQAPRKAAPPDVAPGAKPAAIAVAPTPRRDGASTAPPSQEVARRTQTAAAKTAAAAPVRPIESPAATPATLASTPPAAAEAATAPSVYIHVRSEAQRAWAEQQLVRPLTARGFRVSGIRVVPSGPEVADIRYYHLAQRDEAIRIAIALRDSGVRAQHLKQLDDTLPAAPARQYEVWLPAAE